MVRGAGSQGRARFRSALGQFLAQASHEDLDRVRVTVEILRIDVLRKFGPRHDLTLVMHEVAQDSQFVTGERYRSPSTLSRPALLSSTSGPHSSSAGVAASAPNQRPHSREQLFDVKGLVR